MVANPWLPLIEKPRLTHSVDLEVVPQKIEALGDGRWRLERLDRCERLLNCTIDGGPERGYHRWGTERLSEHTCERRIASR